MGPKPGHKKERLETIVHDVAEDQASRKTPSKSHGERKNTWNPVNRARLAAVRLSVTNCMGDKLKETVGLWKGGERVTLLWKIRR